MKLFSETLSIDELQARKAAAQMLLASKRKADLYVKANGMFVIVQPNREDFFTINESQAVAFWNDINTTS